MFDETQRRELAVGFAQTINRASAENDSNTPDYIAAEYLVRCLEVYGDTVTQRDAWNGDAVLKDIPAA